MGDDGVEPTELAGVAEAETESVHAWALDDDEDESETRRLTPRRITDAALAGGLVLIAAAGVVALLVIRGAWQIDPAPLPVVAAPPPPPAPSTAAPTTTTVRAQPAPPGPWITPTKPVTVTVQAPPPTQVESASEVNANDADFINRMRNDGWYITNPWLMTERARWFCSMLRQGVDPAILNNQIAAEGGLDSTGALLFTSNAMLAYPGCRFGAGQ